MLGANWGHPSLNLHVVFAQSNCCQSPGLLEYKTECLLSVPRTEQVSLHGRGMVGMVAAIVGRSCWYGLTECLPPESWVCWFLNYKVGLEAGRQTHKGARLPQGGWAISVVQPEFQAPYFVTEVRNNPLLLSEEDISPIPAPTPCPKYLVKVSGAPDMMLPIRERRVIGIWSS